MRKLKKIKGNDGGKTLKNILIMIIIKRKKEKEEHLRQQILDDNFKTALKILVTELDVKKTVSSYM